MYLPILKKKFQRLHMLEKKFNIYTVIFFFPKEIKYNYGREPTEKLLKFVFNVSRFLKLVK